MECLNEFTALFTEDVKIALFWAALLIGGIFGTMGKTN